MLGAFQRLQALALLVLLLFSVTMFHFSGMLMQRTANAIDSNPELVAPAVMQHCPQQVNLNTSEHDFAIQFIHVPKSGGGTLRKTFAEWTAKFKTIPITQKDSQNASWDVDSPYGMFLGHRGFGFSNRVAVHYPYTIVVLRDPVDRIVSTYNYIMQEKDTTIEAHNDFLDKSLDEIVESYHARGFNYSLATFFLHQLARVQVQYLCGYHCVWPMPKYGLKVEPKVGFGNAKQQFKLAKLNLERIDIVSVVDDMDTHLLDQLRASPFACLHPPSGFASFSRENQIKPENKQFVKESTKRRLREMLQLEYILYDRAKQLSKQKGDVARACLNT